ncbi:glycoside hydrolase family 99-like domain-containing protein [Alphaproteobacteria bacterium]|nr:glycoside hydrolase family 99-like domain-containing protein [Alphaproteobacteria bacterium]
MPNTSNSSTSPTHIALSKLPEEDQKRDVGIARDEAKLIAFYLPQYHRIAENNEWWGPGFTEWTNVAKGRPNFEGHHQPHIPRDFGFYDLTNVEVMREQAEYARLYGITGFCFHYYWFSGRRILEGPINNFLKSDIQIDFCFCWANENWTRTWDGEDKNVLLEQKYAEGDEESFIQSLVDSFNDSRYIRVNGNPMLVVYRVKHIPDPTASIEKWRAEAVRLGFLGLHVVVVDFYDISDPSEVGADALVEFPPHKFNGPQNHPSNIPALSNPKFTGGIVDYQKVVLQSALRSKPNFTLYRGIIPSWDNTARRQDNPTILINATPSIYGAWLKFIRSYTRLNSPSADENFIFINAWNEWGEGCHLEPDIRWGLGYLEETYRSSFYDGGKWLSSENQEGPLEVAREELLQTMAEIAAYDVVSRPISPIAYQKDKEVLHSYRPASNMVRLISAKLTGWPFLHTVAKQTYKIFVRLIR